MNKKNILLDLDDKKEVKVNSEGSDPGAEFELDLDIAEAIVQVIDGVLIKANEEEIRLLFYYHKPDGIDVEDEVIYCKGVAEFRFSKKNFFNIIKNLNGNLNKLIKNQKKIEDYFQDRLPMYA